MDIDSLLTAEPVRIKAITPPPFQGTTFSISFTSNNTLADELQMISDILKKYLRFMDMTITIEDPGSEADNQQTRPPRFHHINSSWGLSAAKMGRKFQFSLGDKSFTAIISMDGGGHEIYQNKVLVTDRYNLFFHDLSRKINLPYISVRVDSPDFELPFGRHGLRNEEILDPLSEYLREMVLPVYFDDLYECCFQNGRNGLDSSPVFLEDVEDLACALLTFDHSVRQRWANIPLFALWGRPRVSLTELQQLVRQHDRLYLEDSANNGADYTAFDGPVLAINQPKGGLELIKKIFSDQLVNLASKDLVLEQPNSAQHPLGKAERIFESFLGFQPGLLAGFQEQAQGDSGTAGHDSISLDLEGIMADLQQDNNISSEARQARQDLEDIRWRVNYLVERDNTTPCRHQKFLHKDYELVLNLHHPEVAKLLKLSKTMPVLAGHWAMAICLAEGKKFLGHLSPAAREDLLKLDAMVRSYAPPHAIRQRPKNLGTSGLSRKFQEYIRTLTSLHNITGRRG